MFTAQRLLILLAAALVGMAFGTTAADAAPERHKFEITFEGNWGVLWYVRLADGEPHHNCLTGIASDGESSFEAWTRNRRKVTARLYVDRRRGSFFGAVPLETALERKFTFGQVPKGCEIEYGRALGDFDCDDGSPQWGRFRNPPAYLDIAGGRGRVGIGVRREQETEHINEIWDFCPFWGQDEGKIGGQAKLSARKLFSGRTQTVRGLARADVGGGNGDGVHEQEGFQEWRLKIRYLKPRKG
jgi:hypothetical protein